MFKHNFLSYSSHIIIKTLAEIVYFPIWWYSFGLIGTIKKGWRFLIEREKALGFRIWVKNIFIPMYGQQDFAGRAISFFIRVVQIIARGLTLIFWFILVVASLGLWLVAPILLFIATFFQIGTFYGV